MHSAKDFANQNEIRWCPGCGDHAILKHFQSALAKSGVDVHKTVVVSGIGCSSRLPYYMNTYGFHTIHGRSFPIATGLKLSRPDLNVWIITGDGDALSIGGNHFIHLFRRDIDLSILLFNNHVYGLTKGQYSPTSERGQLSKSSPRGSLEKPLNGLHLALSAGASFVARTFDKDAANIQSVIIDAQEHKGSSLVEILQNCPIFNDGVFDSHLDKSIQSEKLIRPVHGMPMIYGENGTQGITLRNGIPEVVDVRESNLAEIWNYNVTSKFHAEWAVRLGFEEFEHLPIAMGVLYKKDRY